MSTDVNAKADPTQDFEQSLRETKRFVLEMYTKMELEKRNIIESLSSLEEGSIEPYKACYASLKEHLKKGGSLTSFFSDNLSFKALFREELFFTIEEGERTGYLMEGFRELMRVYAEAEADRRHSAA